MQEILPELVAPSCKADGRCDRSGIVEHTVNVVQSSPSRLRVRLGALFHKLAGPGREDSEEELLRNEFQFRRSAVAAGEILRRLRASRRQEQEVASLVEKQVPDGAEDWTESEVRRFIAWTGEELLDDVMDLACAERLARKGNSSDLSGFQALRFRVSQERERKLPLRIRDLAISGRDIMKILGLKPGPLIGELLQSLHRDVLEDPSLNERKILMDFLLKEYQIKF